MSPAFLTGWESIAGICPRDASLFPEVDAHGITCRPPKLCVGYNKEPWKVMEKADGMRGPQKMGMRYFPQEKYFIFEIKIWVDLLIK